MDKPLDAALLLAKARSEPRVRSRSRLENYLEVITELRDKGKSYAEVSAWLAENAGHKVSPQMIHKFLSMKTTLPQLPEKSVVPSIKPFPPVIAEVAVENVVVKTETTPDSRVEESDKLELMNEEDARKYRSERLGQASRAVALRDARSDGHQHGWLKRFGPNIPLPAVADVTLDASRNLPKTSLDSSKARGWEYHRN